MTAKEQIHSISVKRKKWVESNRENNFDEGIKKLLTDLYPDNAHFIYELLQNAEDKGAHKVLFQLGSDGLTFSHDGKRLFTPENIEAITSIGNSSKKNDATSIGKFGVGFKSVFAYTSSPEIHSGSYSFKITDLVVPHFLSKASRTLPPDYSTHFIFPFDHESKSPTSAAQEIQKGLLDLTEECLLFLSNIHEIHYSCSGLNPGSIIRQHGEFTKIILTHPSLGNREAEWLCYQHSKPILDEDNKPKNCTVAIAYKVERKANDENKKLQLIPVEPGRVCIFFPADKETSKLKFHLHAPFASTVARDSIRDCAPNRLLRDALADLIVDSLDDIRIRGLLDVDFLAVLPNPADNLSLFYEPICTQIVEAFNEKPLVPTQSKEHAPAQSLVKGPASLYEVFSDLDLAQLTGRKTPLWAASQQRAKSTHIQQRSHLFIQSLDLDEWSFSHLWSCLRNDTNKTKNFLGSMSDEWLYKFYNMFTLTRLQDVSNIPLIRAIKNNEKSFFNADEVYIVNDEHLTDIPRLDIELFVENNEKIPNARIINCLKQLGVSDFNETSAAKMILSNYPGNIDKQQHYEHIKLFIRLFNSKSLRSDDFKNIRFIQGEKGGEITWASPSTIYIDLPYERTELSTWHKNTNLFQLSSRYNDKLKKEEVKSLISIMAFCGSFNYINILRHGNTTRLCEMISRKYFNSRESEYTIKEDFYIDGINDKVKEKSTEISFAIWKTVISCPENCKTMRYRRNLKSEFIQGESTLVHELKQLAWVPDRDGIFRKPSSISRENIHTDFVIDTKNGMLEVIGIKLTSDFEKMPADLKISLGIRNESDFRKFKIMNEKGYTLEDIEKMPNKNDRDSEFPSRESSNPERRKEKLIEKIDEAQSKDYEKRERSVRVSRSSIDAKSWLKQHYSNYSGELICQLCQEPMPFKKRDGELYFESVEIFDDMEKEHEALHLALCPLCAAMYKELVKKHPPTIQSVKSKLQSQEGFEVELNLNGDLKKLRFVETHFLDLRTILEESQP